MSNAKLKEQIEAAKIALVNSAEAGTDANAPRKSGNVTQIPKISTDNPQLHLDGASEEPHSLVRAKPQIENQDTIDQSDFKKLEARLQGLEDQIKNQQRDLHTLLQKLRDITAKSQAITKPRKSKVMKKWVVGSALCMMSFGAAYYWLSAEVITRTIYQVIGSLVAIVETLAGKM